MQQGISWHTLSYSIAVNMVTSLLVCLGRKIITKNSKLVKSLGGRIKLGEGPHPASGPSVEQPWFGLYCVTSENFYECSNFLTNVFKERQSAVVVSTFSLRRSTPKL